MASSKSNMTLVTILLFFARSYLVRHYTHVSFHSQGLIGSGFMRGRGGGKELFNVKEAQVD